MIVLWLAALVVFIVVEAVTYTLTSIWFAAGSLAALIFAAVGLPVWSQIVIFLAIAIATLILTRPLVEKYVYHGKKTPTNADALLQTEALVVEDIDNLSAKGTVAVGGKIWSARSDNGEPIAAGAKVTVLRIEGVKLLVSAAPLEEKNI